MAKPPRNDEGTDDASPLTISPEKVCFIIIKAKEFDAKDELTEPDPAPTRPTTTTSRCWKIMATTPSSRS